jgi:hypothetical protein
MIKDSEKRVLLLTGSDSNMHPVLDLTIPSKLRYARKYGYDFMSLSSFKKYPEYNIDNDHIGLGFSRTLYMFKMLEHYDVIMWLDADSIITNDSYSIDKFLTEDHTLYFSYDWPVASDGSTNHRGFSGGNFILQHTKNISEVFQMFMYKSQTYLKDSGADQACFNWIYNHTNIRSHIKILDHKYLGAVPEFIKTTEVWRNDKNRVGPNSTFNIASPWNEDCFIAHLTGCSTADRINMLNNQLKKYL